MKKFIIILTIILITSSSVVYAFRMPKPTKITEINPASLKQLNDALEQLWNITNGRYTYSISTIAPNGNLKGLTGDAIIYNNSGTFELWINDGTGNGTVWQKI